MLICEVGVFRPPLSLRGQTKLKKVLHHGFLSRRLVCLLVLKSTNIVGNDPSMSSEPGMMKANFVAILAGVYSLQYVLDLNRRIRKMSRIRKTYL